MTANVNVCFEDYVDVEVDFDDLEIDELLQELGRRYESGQYQMINEFFEKYQKKFSFDFNFTYYPNKEYAKEYFENFCPNYENIIKFIKENY